jgi:putative ABC transport system permease protein
MSLAANLRFLSRRKAVALVAVLTMGFALGANTTAFSVVRAFLFSGFAVPEPDRLVLIAPERELPGQGAVIFNDAYPNYQLLRATQHAFAEVTCFTQGIAAWDDHGSIRSLRTTLATATFFPTVRVSPALGRAFNADEEGPSPAPVVVVSHAFWRTALGGDPAAVGRPITLNGVPTTVIGVMPVGFAQPVPTDVWQPFDLPEAQRTNITGARILTIFGRIADGRTREAAVAELAGFTERSREASRKDNRDYHYVIQTLRELLLNGADDTVLLIQAGSVVLLLLAVLNLASVLVAWGFERKREMAVRQALGADGGRVVGLLLSQSALVVGAGLLVGLGLAAFAVAAIRRLDLGPELGSFFGHVRLDRGVLATSAAVAAGAALLAGTLPAWLGRRPDLVTALRASSRGATLSAGALRWQQAMVVGQAALSIVVLTAAALVGLTFRNLTEVPIGFASDHRAVARVTLPISAYAAHADRVRFATALETALSREAGLRSAGFSNTLPVGDPGWGGRFLVPGPDGSLPSESMLFHFRRVSPRYLQTVGIPLLQGRYLDAHDDSSSVRVALVSASLAAKHFPDGQVLGRRLYRVGGSAAPEPFEIVGVVGDVMDGGYTAPPGSAVYVPYAQVSVNWLSIVAETEGAPEAGLAAIRRALAAADPIVAASSTTTLNALVRQANALPRLRAVVLAALALVAVTIVALGSYGVMRQLVASREREMALRLVFGARPAVLGRAVFRQVARLTLPGVALGLVGAWLVAGALRAFLFGVAPRSVGVLAGVGLVVVGLAALTAAPSALRAMRIDPKGIVSSG